MRSNFVISGLSAALVLVCGGAAQAGQPGEVHEVTVVDADGWTRASIDVANDARYEVFSLANPDRLVVDLHQSRLAGDFSLPGPDGMVANVRSGEPTPGNVRLVFDLAAKVRPKSALHRENGRTRLVIEMRDAGARPESGAKPGSRLAKRAVQAAPLSDIAEANARANAPEDSGVRASAAFAPRNGAAMSQDAADTAVSASVARSPANPDAGLQSADAAPPVDRTAGADTRHGALKAIDPSPADPSAISSSVDDPPADADSDARPVASHPGARTVRDVLGTGLRKIVVAVDAGHGGQDTGAKGYSGTYEKNVTLATARELARQINAEPGMKAVLTRDGDYFVPLAERYRKAREAKADLFISVHCDAEPGHDATGSSVWVLSERGVTSQAAKWLADRENAADLVGGVKLSDKDDTLASVLLDLSQSATMKASEDAAERVHQALRDIGRTHKAHPERANFVVLRSPDVPSMLVETAFITNQDEEQRLNDPGYRARLASAVLSGVKGYFIDTPLPGTEFAFLHERGSRRTRAVDAAAPPRMVAAAMQPDADIPDASNSDASANQAPLQLATAGDGPRIHVVQRGERLIDISVRYGVSVMRLRDANELQGNQIHPGQQLVIPGKLKSG